MKEKYFSHEVEISWSTQIRYIFFKEIKGATVARSTALRRSKHPRDPASQFFFIGDEERNPNVHENSCV